MSSSDQNSSRVNLGKFCADEKLASYVWDSYDKPLYKIYRDPYPIGSMAMVYLPTWMIHFYGIHVGRYTNPMDPMGKVIPSLKNQHFIERNKGFDPNYNDLSRGWSP